jgi:tetratricopeptide (TPR) repeat protein
VQQPGTRAGQTEDEPEARVPLRLAVTRGALGLELYEGVQLGPLEVKQLVLTLPGLKFPLDLSGGVPVFRNRRGDLERLVLGVSLDALARWSRSHLNEIVGPLVRPPAFWCAPPVLSMGLTGSGAALAFDLLWAPLDQTARFVISNARASNLEAPALSQALRAVDSLFGRWARRTGRVLEFEQVALRVARSLLPAIGARAPATARVRFGVLAAHGDALEAELDSSFGPPGLSKEAVQALELAGLAREGDEALLSGDLSLARRAYLSALEQAPRHPHLSRLIAEIDVIAGHRTEAALALLGEAEPVVRGGLAAVELLALTGDRKSAREAARHMVQIEPYGPLSAYVWARSADLEDSVKERMLALDQAVARAPAVSAVRWKRFAARLEQRDVKGALGDAEHLEAGAVGALERHAVCRRAADEFLHAGLVRDAGKLFERALRYVPADAAATAGLGRAFAQLGRNDRAMALLERAISLSERHGAPEPRALLDLAELLAGAAGDLPQAIARVRQVPASSECALRARGLEARWRAALGDIVGASQAFARVREALELASEHAPEGAAWLLEAARFERDVNDDVMAAERHLAQALRLAPDDGAVADAYRTAARALADLLRARREAGSS